MKQHILAALKEEFDQWDRLLAGLTDEQATAPHAPSSWSTKDNMAHLWAWQQRSVARMEAAALDREPQFPAWPANLDPEAEDNTEQTNNWIYESNRARPWPEVYQSWRSGYLRFMELGNAISERDLLDSTRYAWLDGHALAFILVASYDHHQEHLDLQRAWLGQHSS